jgi:hypothetical protein
VDISCTLDLARFHKKELRMHPTAGHDITLDVPEWCAEQIAQWLKQTGHKLQNRM